jgi:hypothetical protein
MSANDNTTERTVAPMNRLESGLLLRMCADFLSQFMWVLSSLNE